MLTVNVQNVSTALENRCVRSQMAFIDRLATATHPGDRRSVNRRIGAVLGVIMTDGLIVQRVVGDRGRCENCGCCCCFWYWAGVERSFHDHMQ